jgi:hypothetical protein
MSFSPVFTRFFLLPGGGAQKPGYEELVVDAIPYGSMTSVKAIAYRAAIHARLNRYETHLVLNNISYL